jgi:hypothetical protein
MSGYPYIFQDLVDAGILRPVQPSASSGWTKYKTGREFSPGIVPGAVLDLHAERANGGVSPGVNSPPTTQWYDVSGNGNHGTLNGFTAWDGVTDGWTDDPALRFAGAQVVTLPAMRVCDDKTWAYDLWFATTAAVTMDILTEGQLGGSGGLCVVRLVSGSTANFIVRDAAGNTITLIGPSSLNDGEAHNIVAGGNGAYMRMWVDGAVAGQTTMLIPAGDIVTDFSVIGARYPSGGNYFVGKLLAARSYAANLSDAQVAQNHAAGPEWDKRTASALTIPLTLGNTAWTVAGRYSGLWAHNDSLAHNLLTLRSGADARATVYKHTDNKLYASVNDGTDTASSASAAQTLAADTVNTFVARGTWGSTVNLSINGVPSTQGNASLVGAQNIDSLVIDGGPSGSIGPLILSPTNKGANWQAAVEAAGFSDPLRLVRDYMAVGDYIVPFGYSSTAYRKVR